MKLQSVFGTAILLSSAPTLALAQSGAGAYAESYLTNTSYSGADVTVSEYDWYQLTNVFNGFYSYGSYFDYSSGYSDGMSYNDSTGESVAYAIPGGSYDVNDENGGIYYQITNNNPNQGEWAWLFFDGYSEAAAEGNASGYGWAEGGSEIINYTNGDYISDGVTAESGEIGPAWYETDWYYDIAGSVSSSYSVTYAPMDSYVETSQDFALYYGIYLAPGTSENIGVFEGTEHEAYQTTPGPAALAPFGIGLAGALRRRRRK